MTAELFINLFVILPAVCAIALIVIFHYMKKY